MALKADSPRQPEDRLAREAEVDSPRTPLVVRSRHAASYLRSAVGIALMLFAVAVASVAAAAYSGHFYWDTGEMFPPGTEVSGVIYIVCVANCNATLNVGLRTPGWHFGGTHEIARMSTNEPLRVFYETRLLGSVDGSLILEIKDLFGNVIETMQLGVRNAPTHSVTGPREAIEGEQVEYTASCSWPAGNLSVGLGWAECAWGWRTGGYRYDNSDFTPMAYGIIGHVVFPDNGTYTLRCSMTNTLGQSVFCDTRVDVLNAEPEIATIAKIYALEGQRFKLPPIEFTDPGTLDTHRVEVTEAWHRWGRRALFASNGYTATSPLQGGVVGPGPLLTAHAGDVVFLRVEVEDDDGGTAHQTISVYVTDASGNMPVRLSSYRTYQWGVGISVRPKAAYFTDHDAGDTHTATIDWGDGHEDAALVSGREITFPEHVYAEAGTYDGTIRVTDGTAEDSSSFRALLHPCGEIKNVRLVEPVEPLIIPRLPYELPTKLEWTIEGGSARITQWFIGVDETDIGSGRAYYPQIMLSDEGLRTCVGETVVAFPIGTSEASDTLSASVTYSCLGSDEVRYAHAESIPIRYGEDARATQVAGVAIAFSNPTSDTVVIRTHELPKRLDTTVAQLLAEDTYLSDLTIDVDPDVAGSNLSMTETIEAVASRGESRHPLHVTFPVGTPPGEYKLGATLGYSYDDGTTMAYARAREITVEVVEPKITVEWVDVEDPFVIGELPCSREVGVRWTVEDGYHRSGPHRRR